MPDEPDGQEGEPRENDHLVEPMYAGLQAKRRADAPPAARRWIWVLACAIGIAIALVAYLF